MTCPHCGKENEEVEAAEMAAFDDDSAIDLEAPMVYYYCE